MNELTHGSLFAGIGGFDLGFERAGIKTVWQVEIDEYCRKVLAKHFPTAERYGDIRECGSHNLAPVDIISGGFPCQDISNAGKRTGIDGERSGLWSEYARIIRELRPRYVVVENVAALLHRGMERVLGDLAASGYDAEWDCLSAGVFGAHFLRDRVFIVATHTKSGSCRLQGERPKPIGTWSEQQFARLLHDHLEHAVPAGKRGRISDGIPKRVDRLKGLGNAVIPQITEWIGRRIDEAHGSADPDEQASRGTRLGARV
jgi:DNA (cytosine-5)-methyltransferase 1